MRTAGPLSALTVAALLAGCVGTSRGEPVAANPPVRATESTTSSPTPDNHGAPRVDVPLDATRYLDDPCAILDRAQLAGLGVVRPGTPFTDGPIAERVGPQCVWHARPEVDSSIDVGLVTGDTTGLGGVYAARDTEEYFEETTVQGYPAVFHSPVDGRAMGTCNISVGISNTFSFRSAEAGGRGAVDACARAKTIADAVVTTLKGGA